MDSTDATRLMDCRDELKKLLVEEVREVIATWISLTDIQRLMGASLLVFKNKSDVPGCMSEEEIRKVWMHAVGLRVLSAVQLRHSELTRWQALELDEIKTHRWKIIASSAVTGVGLQEGVDWVVRDAKERMFLY